MTGSDARTSVLPGRTGLSALRDLNVQACRNIANEQGQPLPGLAALTALTALNLRNCDGLRDGALEVWPPRAVALPHWLVLCGLRGLRGTA